MANFLLLVSVSILIGLGMIISAAYLNGKVEDKKGELKHLRFIWYYSKKCAFCGCKKDWRNLNE